MVFFRASRGSQALRDVLGETFEGALIGDFFSADVAYTNPRQQFCLAHLIRDLKFLTTLSDAATRVFGKHVLEHFCCVFWLWHKRQPSAPERFLHAGGAPPGQATTLQTRLLKH